MQKQTYSQEFVDSVLLDTLQKKYYFWLEEKFKLYQRASFLFVLLVPMFAVLFQLLKTYDNPQILELVFLIFLTISLVFSMGSLFRSLAFHKYTYIFYSETIIKHYDYEKKYYEYVKKWNKPDKNFVPLIKKLAQEYAKANIKNVKENQERAILLRRSTISMASFAVILIIFFSYDFFISGTKFLSGLFHFLTYS